MKKLFLFATIAAAGLLASCSSTDDTIGNAQNTAIEDVNDEGSPAIKIGIGNIANMATRGTGTVGGVNTGAGNVLTDNVWAGQKINVFMFQKKVPDNAAPGAHATESTLNLARTNGVALYNDTEMYTPGTPLNLIPGMQVNTTGEGEAMITTGAIQYYPLEGNFDFYGYHYDDAYPGGDLDNKVLNTSGATKWTVPFEIDGSQDLMSTKAELTGAIDDAATPSQKYIMAHAGTAPTAPETEYSRSKDYYSAYAARKNVQPTLTFKHLLTRFSFQVKAGKPSAGGYEAAHNNVTRVTETQKTAAITGGCDADEFEVYSYTMTGATILPATYNANTTDLSKATRWTPDNENTPTIYTWAGSTTMTVATLTALGYDVADITGEAVALYTHAHPVGAQENPRKAVMIKDIKLKSKKTGDLVVAWIGDEFEATTYEIGVASDAQYATFGDHQGNWTVDPTDATKYTYNTPNPLTQAQYDALNAAEQALATAVDVDTKKIEWSAAQPDWLTLKARPYAKKNDGAAAAIVTDFQDLEDAKTDLETLKSTLETEAAGLTGDALAQKQAEIDKVTERITALADSAANREATSITEVVYNQLKNEFKQGGASEKYKIIANNLNENLIPLAPVAAVYNAAGGDDEAKYPKTDVGEALIVAPKYEGNYELEVTLQQNMPNNWNRPDDVSIQTTTLKLNVLPPNGGFKINTSYNIILTVYSLERIEVIAVITPWEQATSDVEVGGDE